MLELSIEKVTCETGRNRFKGNMPENEKDKERNMLKEKNMQTVTRVGRFNGLASLAAALLMVSASCLQAAVYTNANVDADWDSTSRWVGGVAPNWGDTANSNTLLWDVTLATAAYCTNSTGSGTFNINGLKVLNPSAQIYVTNNSSAFLIRGSGSAGAGIDMSAATVDMTLDGSAANKMLYFEGDTYTISIATNRTLRLLNTQGEAVRIRNATVNLNGPGTLVFNKDWVVGADYAAGVATLNIDSGTLTNSADGVLYVGNGTTGVVNQAGGRVALYKMYAGQTRSGTYNLSGGTLTVRDNLLVGINANNGVLNVTGGTLVQAGGTFHIGYNRSGTGSYIQSGNSTVTANVFRVAGASSGNVTISNGTFYAKSWDRLAREDSTTGRLWLAGGRAILPQFPTLRGSGAYADITFDGGTLSPRIASTTYMQGLDHAYLTANGAVFDTAGNNITVAQVLENAASQIGTLTKTGTGTLTLSGTNTYSGATVVTNGTLNLTHAQCLATNSTVYLYTTATNNLAFTGTNTIRMLYVNGELQQAKRVYGANTLGGAKNLSPVLSGSGYYYPAEGAAPRGTMIQIF